MKITYDDKARVYGVSITHPDTLTWYNTSDIVELRELFIERMTELFNEAICKQLGNQVKEVMI